MTPAKHRARIQSDIARIQAGGGTEIFRALDAAYQALVDHARARESTSSCSPTARRRRTASAISCRRWRPRASRVTTVGLGGGVDESLLRMIARRRRRSLLQGRSTRSSCRASSRARPRWCRRSAAVEEYFQPQRRRARGLPARHRHRRRAVPPRLRRDEDEAAARAGDPRERDRRADPRALARGPRLVARVDERREEPLGRRVAALAAATASSGVSSCASTCARRSGSSSTCAPRSIRRRATCKRVDRRDRRRRRIPERARREAHDRPGPQPERRDAKKVPMRQTAPGRYEADFPLDRYGSFLLHASLEKTRRRRRAADRARSAQPSPRASAT